MREEFESVGKELNVTRRLSHFQPTNWFFLYAINQADINPSTQDLIRRYSSYKYGNDGDSTQFGVEIEGLIRRIKGRSLEEDREQWVLFTPPYSVVEPAVRPLGNKIASAFAISHIDFRTSSGGDRSAPYAAIVDTRSRIQAKLSVHIFVPDPAAIRGKKALVIDDMITTGATAAYMEQTLSQDFGLAQVVTFALVDLVASSPAFEEDINRFLVTSGNIDELVRILNNSKGPINRHILKSFYGQDKDIFEIIKGRLSASFLERVTEAATKYYGNN